jgi:glycosyltransferase involved in cell wall biosynthesis
VSDKKALLISMVFHPDEVAVANLFTNLSVELASSGIDIDVWCAQPSYTNKKRQPRKIEYAGINIKYLRATTFHKDNLLGRVSNILTFSFNVLIRLLFSKDKTRVISHTTPPFIAIPISFVCRIKNRKFIYVLMDIFPDGLVRLGQFSSRNFFIKIWRFMHHAALKRSEYIIVIGRDMKEWVDGFYPEGSEKTIYIPLWQDADLIKPVEFTTNPFVEKYGLKDTFVVQYSGNMGLWNDMRTLGLAINKKPEGVKFLIIGGGMRKKELLDSLADQSNTIFLSFQENPDFAYSVTACHAGIVSLRENLEGMAVPSKIIGIMAAGIPVIAMVPLKSEIAYIIDEEKCGLIVTPGDSDELIVAINKLKSDEEMRKRMGRNGRDAFLRKYTTKIIAEKYLSILTY